MTTLQLDAPIDAIDRRFRMLASSFAGRLATNFWTTSGSALVGQSDLGGTASYWSWVPQDRTPPQEDPYLLETSPGTWTNWPTAASLGIEPTQAFPKRVPLDPLEGLAVSVANKDQRNFGLMLDAIDWKARSADDHARAARLSMAMDMPLLARKLVSDGLRRYPNDDALILLGRLLAPPHVISIGLPPDPTIEANQTWFRQHSGEYQPGRAGLPDRFRNLPCRAAPRR